MPKYMIDTTLAGKEKIDLKSIKSRTRTSYHDYYFANEVSDGKSFKLKDKSLYGATFANLSLKNAVFKDINFSYSVFNNCYFRGAQFTNCNFTGCKFIDCNFMKAGMIGCDLQYSHWKRTTIGKDLVLTNLPAYENIAQALLINMRINAISMGEYDDARCFVYESEKQSRRHNLKKFKANEEYYRIKKYTTDERFIALLKYLQSHTERIFWGYGEKILNLVLTAAGIIFIFAIVYFLKGHVFFLANHNSIMGGFIESFKLSLAVFTSLGFINVDASLRNHLYNWFLLEAPFGLVFISFLAASLHRKISMRRD